MKTEQAFSKMAEEKNTRDAFMAFIADDGLLFRPGRSERKEVDAWSIRVPPSDKKPLLAWQPNVCGDGGDGRYGIHDWTMGIQSDIKDEKPSGYGHFVTVWKKQADGSWKFVVDLGIGHPQSGGPQTLWQPTDTNKNPSFKPVDVATATEGLLTRDRKYTEESKQDLAKAFAGYASPDVRLYRAGNLPYIGRQAAAEALAARTKGQIVSQPISGDVSRAGDLGYTHGTYEITDDTKKVIERGSYVRIWKVEGGVWRIVMDVTNVHPK